MKHIIQLSYICLCCLTLLLTGCKDDDELTLIAPSATGTFTDARDGQTYGYVTYAGKDWMTENLRYRLSSSAKCLIYQSASNFQNGTTSTEYLSKYGCLYTLNGAKEAVPDGWRLPTDADWQQLEQALGMNADDAASLEWRGDCATQFMSGALHVLMAGYYTTHTIMSTSGYRFMGARTYFWTSTPDTSKTGTYYLYREFNYNNTAIYRQSMETEKNFLSVRLVREHQ